MIVWLQAVEHVWPESLRGEGEAADADGQMLPGALHAHPIGTLPSQAPHAVQPAFVDLEWMLLSDS